MRNMKTWVKRAFRTFVQALVGTVSAGIVTAVSGASDVKGLKIALLTLGASAVSAGMAAVMNLKEE